ncbi:hypothetical protein LBW89_06660 [Paenibacillus sp. alder61]|uniref:hypothetical protein n=1 Tax=Paenibacillus sp. alder61 TaxID=2862948 RepID=UPI001CD19675|nr:hypothetical protein [Paenibacillus sp. alder61]MCA1292693.1 hypothetical protein [Paenibacillus sp. alder61]
MFRRLAREQVKFDIRLPGHITDPAAARDVSLLSEIYAERALTAAGKFDTRNGNRYYTDYVQRLLAQVAE